MKARLEVNLFLNVNHFLENDSIIYIVHEDFFYVKPALTRFKSLSHCIFSHAAFSLRQRSVLIKLISY